MKKFGIALLVVSCIALPIMAQANIIVDPNCNGSIFVGQPTSIPTGWYSTDQGNVNFSMTGGILTATAGATNDGTGASQIRNQKLNLPAEWLPNDNGTNPIYNSYTIQFDYMTVGTFGTSPTVGQSMVEAYVLQYTGVDNGGSGDWSNSTVALAQTNGQWVHFSKTFNLLFPHTDAWTAGTQSMGFKSKVWLSQGSSVSYDNFILQPTAVPEPGSIVALLSGLGGMMVIRRKRA